LFQEFDLWAPTWQKEMGWVSEAGKLKSKMSPTDLDKQIAKGKYGIESLKFSTQLSTSEL
jgi:hypothetical protein